jgi:capsular exopolysaccharide synthesis family protein
MPDNRRPAAPGGQMSSSVLKKAYERWQTTGGPRGGDPRGGDPRPVSDDHELGSLLGIPAAAVEDYATLAGRIELVLANEVRRTMVVGGTGRGTGATTVAVGLAAALAVTTRSPVLLVDGNLRTPALHIKFHVERAPGLTEVVRDGAGIAHVAHATAVPRLTLLTAGGEVRSPQSFFQLPAFREQLQAWTRDHAYVVIDSAPFGPVADPLTLAQATSGAVMVVEAGRTVREVAAETSEEMRRAGIRVLGAVLNRRRFYVPDWIYRRI